MGISSETWARSFLSGVGRPVLIYTVNLFNLYSTSRLTPDKKDLNRSFSLEIPIH